MRHPHQPPYRFVDQNGIRLCLYTLFDGRQVRAACAYGPAGLAGDFRPDENRAVFETSPALLHPDKDTP